MPNRLDLARRLHDGPAQQIVALGLSLDEVIANPNLTAESRLRLREIRLELLGLSRSLRDEIYLLHKLRIQELPDILKKVLACQEIKLQLPTFQMNIEVEDAIVRSVREAARNSARHSRCTEFKVDFTISNQSLEIRISDNGVGGISHADRSFGVRNIQEAIAALGGSVRWESDNSGSRYFLKVDLK